MKLYRIHTNYIMNITQHILNMKQIISFNQDTLVVLFLITHSNIVVAIN
jgi:hypothetical protein